MARTKGEASSKKSKRPAMSPEARENELISLAVDQAEKQMLEGTASSQVITHFLKLATVKSKLELEKLTRENELLRAKTEAIEAQKNTEEMYKRVLSAMRSYSGMEDIDE